MPRPSILVTQTLCQDGKVTHSLPSVTHKLRTVHEMRDIHECHVTHLLNNFVVISHDTLENMFEHFKRTILLDPHRHASPRILSRVYIKMFYKF